MEERLMGINTSVINNIEIDGGDITAYVQISGGRVSLSFDGRSQQFMQNMTLGELQEFIDIAVKSLEEANNESSTSK